MLRTLREGGNQALDGNSFTGQSNAAAEYSCFIMSRPAYLIFAIDIVTRPTHSIEYLF